MNAFHEPVLIREALDMLQVKRGKRYIDATAGGGGHTAEILAKGGCVLALDQDKDAVSELTKRFKNVENLVITQANFKDLEEIARREGFGEVNGILFDLGVSSHELNSSKRGFSTRFKESVLDMRMNQDNPMNAGQIVNTASEEELYDILSQFGEEELSRPISQNIVRIRKLVPFKTTGDLISAIESVVSDKRKLNGVLARVFQSLRIAVNDELAALRSGLNAASRLLVFGGRLVVISFHSLEDRLVKLNLVSGPWNILTRKAIVPTIAEIKINKRAHSAKLRAAIRI